jgi:hypothetical protein
MSAKKYTFNYAEILNQSRNFMGKFVYFIRQAYVWRTCNNSGT